MPSCATRSSSCPLTSRYRSPRTTARYYYALRSVDADGIESADSESVSIVPSAAAASLSSSGSGSGPAVAVCFISTTQMAFNPDIMRGLAILGFIAILWRLFFRIRAYALRRRGPNVFTQKRDCRPASKEHKFSNLNGDPPSSSAE